MTVIYKICPRTLWEEAERLGVYRGAGIDAEDGFIHFSTREQVADTANRHFAGLANLVLVAVDAESLGPSLKWEKSRKGKLFPHLYGVLPVNQTLWVRELPLGFGGTHDFPPEVTG
jgi:uncharacterized protein (DUF952 family)